MQLVTEGIIEDEQNNNVSTEYPNKLLTNFWSY